MGNDLGDLRIRLSIETFNGGQLFAVTLLRMTGDGPEEISSDYIYMRDFADYLDKSRPKP